MFWPSGVAFAVTMEQLFFGALALFTITFEAIHFVGGRGAPSFQHFFAELLAEQNLPTTIAANKRCTSHACTHFIFAIETAHVLSFGSRFLPNLLSRFRKRGTKPIQGFLDLDTVVIVRATSARKLHCLQPRLLASRLLLRFVLLDSFQAALASS